MFLKIKATSGREDLVKSWVDCEKRVLKQRKLISLEVIQEYVKLRNISGLNGEQREALEDIEGRLNAQVDEAEQVGLWHPSRPWMDWKD